MDEHEALKFYLRVALSAFLCCTAYVHFVRPDYVWTARLCEMIPRWIPIKRHRRVIISVGVFQLLIAALLHAPTVQKWAGWAFMAMVVAIWPADWHNVRERSRKKREDLNGELPRMGEWDWMQWVLWLRLPLQPVFLLWAYWCTHTPANHNILQVVL